MELQDALTMTMRSIYLKGANEAKVTTGQDGVIRWNLLRNLMDYNDNVERRLFDEELIEQKVAEDASDIYEIIDALNDQYVVFTGTLAKAGIAGIRIPQDDYRYVKYLAIPGLVESLGYDFTYNLNETIKEIDSRVGDVDETTGKFEKDKSPEAQANWYKAHYKRIVDVTDS